ncbi:MAG: nucleoside deaminase [Methyloligellaceae bacterium]
MRGLLSRRRLVASIGVSPIILNSPAVSSRSAAPPLEPIQQPANGTDIALIERAFEMRQLALEKGDQAYGAVVAKDGVVIGQSWSRVIIDQDPTGHAEMSAIRDASLRLGSRHLTGAVLYSSSPPCPMCEAAAYWAGIQRLVSSRNVNDLGPPKLCGA